MTATSATRRAVAVPAQQSSPVRHRPRVTIGTDGSTWGDAALEWALRHAWLVNAGLKVYSAKTSDDQAIAKRLDVYRWLHASVTTSEETPEHTLLTASADTDLLVLGHHGHSHHNLGIGHLVLPVVTGSRCDTVVVRGEPRAVRAEHGWVTAAVGGRHDESIIRRATEIATRYRDGLRIVHAWPLPGPRAVAADGQPNEVLDWARRLVTKVSPTLTPSLHLVRSRPHEAVETCARSDLLVMGPGSHPGRLSPVTRTALHLSPCPVLVVRPT
ncbi:universal stress protein [Actinosynnema sp. ALI-1.44]|uniref:universal stress protein n=1 Tax=Actinosynnema sp. ALI-1.44 TaxID=1933779 RepID=UPI00143CFEDE|nr:universal stress protein [Actinosynnema sp. ALI-1.44]